jgi:hypothetical protein
MAINPRCIAQVNAAAGRKLTEAQLRNIEERLHSSARQLAYEANQDPALAQQWRQMSADQRTLASADRAMQDIKDEAAKKVERANLQILKTAATEDRIRSAQARVPRDNLVRKILGLSDREPTRTDALVRDMERAEVLAKSIQRGGISKMLDTVEAASSGQGAGLGRRAAMFLFDVDNPAMTRDLAAEIYGKADGRTGNKLAQKGAQAWLDAIENQRARFNAGGGDVGRLDYGYIPLPDSQIRMMRAGRDQWVADVLPEVDRSRYLKPDGSRLNDAEVADVLGRIYDTKASGGSNKTDPGKFRGDGLRANRGSQHRELHLKDGEAYLRYLSKYGDGTLYDAMMGHMGKIARDIALVEQYGPNPANQMRLQFDLAKRADKVPDDKSLPRKFLMRPESYWDVLSGNATAPDSAAVAAAGQGVRNVQTAGKLAGALLSSVTDIGTYFVTTGFNKLPYFDAIKNIGAAQGKGAKQFLNMHGLMAESLIGDLNRWTGEHIANTVTGRLANSTLRLSLLNAWTDGLRRAFSLTMMQGMARLHGKDWGSLTAYDRWRLESKGLTEADWGAIQQAPLDSLNGTNVLAPGSITNPQVRSKYLAVLLDESETAIINPDLATRALATGGGTQAGTVRGELARAVMQFKSFPFAMISRHWRRITDIPPGLDGTPAIANPLVYAGALGASLTMLGAVAFQAKQVTQGKDPVDMTTPKFWGRAAAQGGAFGFYGDLMLGDTTDTLTPGDTMFRLLGPTAGSAADAFELTKGNIDEALAGKDTHAAAEGVRFARSHLPFINLWYARAALDRAVLHSLQENLSPGYLKRQRQRAHKEWNQDYWWQPGEMTPDRAPDVSAVSGP